MSRPKIGYEVKGVYPKMGIPFSQQVANEVSGWQVIPNKPQYLSEYREILEALKENTQVSPSGWGMK